VHIYLLREGDVIQTSYRGEEYKFLIFKGGECIFYHKRGVECNSSIFEGRGV